MNRNHKEPVTKENIEELSHLAFHSKPSLDIPMSDDDLELWDKGVAIIRIYSTLRIPVYVEADDMEHRRFTTIGTCSAFSEGELKTNDENLWGDIIECRRETNEQDLKSYMLTIFCDKGEVKVNGYPDVGPYPIAGLEIRNTIRGVERKPEDDVKYLRRAYQDYLRYQE